MRKGMFLALCLLLPLWGGDSFRIGFYQLSSKAMNSTDFKIGMEVWIKEIAGRYGIETHVRYYKKAEKLAKDFEKNVINMAVASPLIFVNYFDESLMIPGVVGFKTSKAKSSKMLLLVRKQALKKPLGTLLKRPVSVPVVADSAELYIHYLALREKFDRPIKFIRTKNGNQAILKLFFKKSDIAVVSQATFDMAAELNPQIKERLAVYAETELPIGSYAFIRKGIDPELYKKIIEHSLNLPKTPRGKQVLVLFQTDTVEMCNPDDLRTTRKFYRAYLKLLKERGMKPTPPKEGRP